MEKVKWGILGTGRIAKVFGGMLGKLEQACLWAVGSRSLEKAQAFAREYGFEKAYGSYEELLADGEVELVYVASPIGSHYGHVKQCLLAGKHVLCEKALTQSAAEAKELYALAKEKNLFLMEALWSKCQPVFRQLMEWKDQGMFGEIRGVEGRFYTKGNREHRLYRDKNQGGALYDLTIYPLTYACALLGMEPEAVHARAVIDGDGADIMESIQLEYEDGRFASVSGGLSCEKQVSLYVYGSKARVLFTDDEYFYRASRVDVQDWDGKVITSLDEPFDVNGYEYEAWEAMKCVREGQLESKLAPMTDTIQMIRLMEECAAQWEHQHK